MDFQYLRDHPPIPLAKQMEKPESYESPFIDTQKIGGRQDLSRGPLD